MICIIWWFVPYAAVIPGRYWKIPPGWYKSDNYRRRAVRELRAVLSEFGLELPEQTKIRVWDSTAEIRYLVLPMRPEGTDGLSEDELAGWVTRDA